MLTTYKQIFFLFMVVTFSIVLAGCGKNTLSLPGYIEGRFTYISPYYSGILESLPVQKGDEVKAGQLLFTLEPEPEQDELTSAQNRYLAAQSEQERLQTEYDLQIKLLARRQTLQKEKFLSQEDLDTAQAKYNEDIASLAEQKKTVEAALADFKKAQWSAEQKSIYAPSDGLIFDTYFTQGELVQNNTPVLALLNPNQVKIYFYVNESILGQVKLNQVVDVLCDSCNQPVKSKIVFISPKEEYAPPVIYSSEVRDKLVYRIEAQPLVKNAYHILHPGQPITVNLTLDNGNN